MEMIPNKKQKQESKRLMSAPAMKNPNPFPSFQNWDSSYTQSPEFEGEVMS